MIWSDYAQFDHARNHFTQTRPVIHCASSDDLNYSHYRLELLHIHKIFQQCVTWQDGGNQQTYSYDSYGWE